MRRIVVDATSFSDRALDEAVRAVGGGGVIALPTDTLYGLAADPFRPDAVARVFAVKDRAAERALPLIAADAAQIADRLGVMPELARRLASRFWPGPLTLLLPAPAAMRCQAGVWVDGQAKNPKMNCLFPVAVAG